MAEKHWAGWPRLTWEKGRGKQHESYAARKAMMVVSTTTRNGIDDH